jgi:orotate phosphoribosyltransferase
MERKASEILQMGRERLLSLDPVDFSEVELGTSEIIHIARALGFFWQYDYEAAERGKPGKHALLKSGLHSDGFLAFKMLLEIENIRKLMAHQLKLKFKREITIRPSHLVGIPDAATKLAEDLADILGLKTVSVRKVEGRITVMDQLSERDRLLIVEDLCTKGTGFRETVLAIRANNRVVKLLLWELVIVNRGGLEDIDVDGVGAFSIASVANHRIREWEPDPEKCKLCRDYGSVAIKPKASEENWLDITTSQL